MLVCPGVDDDVASARTKAVSLRHLEACQAVASLCAVFPLILRLREGPDHTERVSLFWLWDMIVPIESRSDPPNNLVSQALSVLAPRNHRQSPLNGLTYVPAVRFPPSGLPA